METEPQRAPVSATTQTPKFKEIEVTMPIRAQSLETHSEEALSKINTEERQENPEVEV